MKGAPLRSASSKKDLRPTPDQMYLAAKLNGDYVLSDGAVFETLHDPSHAITPAALQKWNSTYGVAAVSDALRAAWGWPPAGGIENPWAYVAGILKGEK